MIEAAPTHDAAALTEHIETRSHARHRARLPEFAALAEKVETAHAGAPDMRADQDDHAAEVAQVRALTGGLALPAGACRMWTVLYEGLGTFIDDLEEHMRLENDVLFPQFESRA